MANLYGVANAPGLPVMYQAIGGASIALPTNTETNFIDTGLIVAPSAGYFYPMVWMTATVLQGATVASNLFFSVRVNGGADQSTCAPDANYLVANARQMFTFTMAGSPSQALFQGSGAHVQVSATSFSQPATLDFNGTWVLIALYRAPDQ